MQKKINYWQQTNRQNFRTGIHSVHLHYSTVLYIQYIRYSYRLQILMYMYEYADIQVHLQVWTYRHSGTCGKEQLFRFTCLCSDIKYRKITQRVFGYCRHFILSSTCLTFEKKSEFLMNNQFHAWLRLSEHQHSLQTQGIIRFSLNIHVKNAEWVGR